MKRKFTTILASSIIATVMVASPLAAQAAPKAPNQNAAKQQTKIQSVKKLEVQVRDQTREQKQEWKQERLEERIRVRGASVNFDTPPVIKEGRTLIPVRAITEGLGAEVAWDQENNTVTIAKDGSTIILVLDSAEVTVNGETYQLDVPAQSINNRTFIPLRFIAEILGEEVAYDEETGDIAIGMPEEENEDLEEDLEPQVDEQEADTESDSEADLEEDESGDTEQATDDSSPEE